MKWTTRKLRKHKSNHERRPLSMLTCYDFQTAKTLNQTEIDLILVGDSLGNVILGYETTCQVSLQDMKTFGAAVKRGAPDKFTIIDMPFGTFANANLALRNGIELFQQTNAEALKIEGANDSILEGIKALTDTGIPVVGHIGLTPQFYHQLGGYFTHGKTEQEKNALIEQAIKLEKVGVSMIVLECVTPEVATEITSTVNVPTIGIGSGTNVDGQVLVINDLLGQSDQAPPKFCSPVKNIFKEKTDAIHQFHQKTINRVDHSIQINNDYESLYN